MERWLGMLVSGDKIIGIDAEVHGAGPIVVQADLSWKLQVGDRSSAYAVLHQQIADYVQDHKIDRVVVKASALGMSGTKLAHLHAAELRGVAIAAAASVTKVSQAAKATISRTFGDRKADEYLKDDAFWEKELAGKSVRTGSREAALVLLAARKKK